MPSIGDITGRIIIQDVGSPAAIKFGENLERASKTIMASMSRATLATETAVREIASKLAKLKGETKETVVGKGLVTDLDTLIKKRAQELSALKAGPVAIEALNIKRYQEAQALRIAAAQVDAGVAAESYLGRTIAANIKTLDRYEHEIDQVAKAQAAATKKAEQQIAAYRKLSDVGSTLTTRVTLPLLALGVGSIKVASDFESSFAGVRKTVDATEEEFSQLQAQLRALAAGPNAIPIDVNNLNAVAEAAGQLGIAKGDIVGFTRTMADLGQTTNLTADEAATATAQFQNIFGAAGKEVDRFGSTLVALGNAGASTERDIISMGLRIAGAGVQLGLSQGQVLAYASSLASMGIDAEAGGSAISKVMIDIALAVSKGGNELANFASVSGMTAAQFKVAFKEDAAGAVASFIEGLGRMKTSGQDVLGTLDAMGITEIRMRDALLRASGAGTLLRDSLKLQAEAWRDNNALTSEAQKRYQTFESQLQLFLNRVKDITITFGTALLPVLLDTLDALNPWIETLKSVAEGFANTSPGFKAFVVGIAAIVAAAGPAVFITGQLLLAWSHIVAFAPGVVTAMNSVAVATQGLAVIGVLLFINEVIKAWGRASEAVTNYNLEVAKIEGNALAFAQQVSQGALNKVVSQGTFDQKIKEADILAGHIKRISGEVEDLNRVIKSGPGDLAFLAKAKLPEKEQELKNLWAAHNKLRSALAGVTIAGERANEAFNPSPFAGLAKDSDKAQDVIGDLTAELIRQTQALKLLQDGLPVERIENLIEAARELDSVNLFDPLVIKAANLKDGIDRIATAFDLAAEAKKRFADAGDDLDTLISKQFATFGGNDPAMVKLVETLREAKSLTDSIKDSEGDRVKLVGRAQQLYEQGFITAIELQAILLANADQWNVELDETQIKFNEIYEKLSYIAEGIAFDLVSNWRRAWKENESIVDATVDTLRDSFLNVLQDIISQWLSTWFKAMAAWLARWIATQRVAQISSAQTAAVSGASGAGGGVGSLLGMGSSAASGASGAGVSTSAMMGAGLAAFALYVVYKGFIEDHERKFARVSISNGAIGSIQSHGGKYFDGIQSAAESILANLKAFLTSIDVTMTRLGNVIIESSKSGWNVSIPGSTGKLFKSMEEAISYAQVLMLKYGEFADSVSTLVQGVISSSKAINIEQLASDIDWAKMLDTQNMEQAALSISNSMDVAIANWKRAQDLFLSFYSVNLPAFEAAVGSIITKLGNDLGAVYNQLAGIEEDPKAAWERQRLAYNAQRAIVLAQLKLWEIEIAARIANYNAQATLIGGGPKDIGGSRDGKGPQSSGGGILGMAFSMLNAASAVNVAVGVIDAGLQALLDIQAQLLAAQEQMPPPLNPEDYKPPKGRGGKGGNKSQLADLREDLLDEINRMAAEAEGPLHAAFADLNNNIEAFRERAKEAKLPAAELARGVELLTAAFQRSIQTQAREMAGLDSELGNRLREIQDFFSEVRALGSAATGISSGEADTLEGQAIAKVGTELSQLIMEFAGLVDPMIAINTKASELRASVIAFAEAAGWSSEQINTALQEIDKGIQGQRLQGINTAMGTLLGILKQAGLYEQESLKFERDNVLMQLQLLEAQFRFYAALDAKTTEMLEAARNFVLSSEFGKDRSSGGVGSDNDIVRVRVVNSDNPDWDDIVDRIKDLVESWREAIDQFADSTASLMTDEGLTNLTQEEQLAFAKSQVEMLAAAAQGGDIEALAKLEQARAEYLAELRESEGGGFGFDKGWDWVMNLTADVLKNAQAAEDALIAKELAKNVQAWAYVMDKLSKELEAAFYINTQDLINAIYNAIGGIPGFASGGVVMKGSRLVRVAEYIPEAIVPLDKLAGMVPYRTHEYDPSSYGRASNASKSSPFGDPSYRDITARLADIAESNTKSAATLASIRDEMRKRN